MSNETFETHRRAVLEDLLPDRQLDVIAVRPTRLGVSAHLFASLGDTSEVTAGPQLEPWRIAA
jgi:hypothetical protein